MVVNVSEASGGTTDVELSEVSGSTWVVDAYMADCDGCDETSGLCETRDEADAWLETHLDSHEDATADDAPATEDEEDGLTGVCYHPRSCVACSQYAEPCGSHRVGDAGHYFCQGR